jgi:hypothetical protein
LSAAADVEATRALLTCASLEGGLAVGQASATQMFRAFLNEIGLDADAAVTVDYHQVKGAHRSGTIRLCVSARLTHSA